MKRHECNDAFLRGYLDAALWTEDPEPGSGDYIETGRAAEMYPELPDYFIAEAIADCAEFREANAALLARAGNEEQNGHDFWMTRNRHGCGYWDRGYDDEVGEGLTYAAQAYGDHYLFLGEDEDS